MADLPPHPAFAAPHACASPITAPPRHPTTTTTTPQALQHYASVPGPHKRTAADLARRLRWRPLSNLVAQYGRTGYVWEQYSDTDGEGKGSHPFTGWTALLVLLAAE